MSFIKKSFFVLSLCLAGAALGAGKKSLEELDKEKAAILIKVNRLEKLLAEEINSLCYFKKTIQQEKFFMDKWGEVVIDPALYAQDIKEEAIRESLRDIKLRLIFK